MQPMRRWFESLIWGTILQFSLYTLIATGIWITLVGLPDLISNRLGVSAPHCLVGHWLYGKLYGGRNILLLQFSSLRLPASKVLSYGYLTPAFILIIEGMLGHGWGNVSLWLGALVTALALAVMALAPD